LEIEENMWPLISLLLEQSNKNKQNIAAKRANEATGSLNSDTARYQNIQNNRIATNALTNQTTSANYGKFNIDELVNGVFTSGNARNQAMNWSQYA
jgi:hypothetical protein